MEFHFCEKCGRKITEDELDSGEALMMGQEYFCPKCRDGALAEVAGSATERAAPPVAARGRSKRLRSSRKTSAHRTSGPRRAVSGGAGRTSGPKRAVSERGKRASGSKRRVSERRGAVGGPASGRASDRMRPVAPAKGGPNVAIIAAVAAAAAAGGLVFLIFGRGGGDGGGEPTAPKPSRKTQTAARKKPAPAPVVKSAPVGVPADAKDANDFQPVNASAAPSDTDGVFKLITAENTYELQAAVGPNGWKVLRAEEAARVGKRGIRVTPLAGENPKAASDNQVAIRLSRSADLSGYRKLGLWMGGKNVEKNAAKVSIVVGTEEVPLTGPGSVEYGTRWKYYAFDLVGKRDDVRGLIIRFNASTPARPANFELYLDEVSAFGRDGGETTVASRPTPPGGGETAEPVAPPRRPGPRPEPPPLREPETTTPTAPPPRRRPPVAREPEPVGPTTPAAPEPAQPLPPPSGDFKVIFRETFDGSGKFYWTADHEKTNTYQGSAGAAKAKHMPNHQYYGNAIGFEHWQIPRPLRVKDGAICQMDDDTYVSFHYFLEGTDEIKFWPRSTQAGKCKGKDLKNCIQGKWTAVSFPGKDLVQPWDKAMKYQPGHELSQVTLTAGKPGGPALTFIIDNFTITKGGAPRDIEVQVARAKRSTAEQTGDPTKEGFYLLPRVVANLKQSYSPDKVTQGKVLKVGGDSASSMSHIAGIKGVTAVKRFSICGKQKGAGDVMVKFPGELAAQKPEIVTIMFDVADLAKSRASMEVKGHYTRIVETTLAAGAIPVLFTLPLPPTGDKDADKLVGEYNKVIMAVGREKSVPVVDAKTILTKDMAGLRKIFSGPKLKKPGHDLLNAAFKDLYEKLAKHVMGRN